MAPKSKAPRLFDKIREKVKPFFTNDDLGFPTALFELKIYHLTALTKEAKLAIYDTQATIDWLTDQLVEKQTELEKLRTDETPDKANLAQRKALTIDMDGINQQIDSELCHYIESLGKLKEGEYKKRLDAFYELIQVEDSEYSEEFEAVASYPKENITAEIFREINSALASYNEQELNVAATATTSEKK